MPSIFGQEAESSSASHDKFSAKVKEQFRIAINLRDIFAIFIDNGECAF